MRKQAAEGRDDSAAASLRSARAVGFAHVGDGRAVGDDEELAAIRCRY
jgi:L-amino acid N-acyltransferase YncA